MDKQENIKKINKQKRRLVIYVVLATVAVVMFYGAYIVVKSVPSKDSIVLSEPANDTDWSIGPKDARVTIVEYSDLQCPACGFYAPIVDDVIKSYASQSVRFVYRHFPLPQHKHARLAAKYAESAGRQGKFFEMTKIIFENQRNWEKLDNAESEFDRYATLIGLDMVKLKNDINNPEIAQKIENDYISGTKSGVSSTPSFFINGKIVDFKPTNESIKSTIEKYLN